MVFSPSSSIICENRKIISWNAEPLQNALDHHLLPVTYGDVVFDRSLGGTILSTEDLFVYLAEHLTPQRILLAGIDRGVWADFPTNKKILEQLSPLSVKNISTNLHESLAIDVTGGMAQKVILMSSLVEKYPAIQVVIFSGIKSGSITQALRGHSPGTSIKQINLV